MFRVKVRIDPACCSALSDRVKTGCPAPPSLARCRRRVARATSRYQPAASAMNDARRRSRALGVTQRYGTDRCARQHLDSSLPAGGMVGLIGPDGVGKSTLLALISGVRKIQHGTVKRARRRHGERAPPQVRASTAHRLHAARSGQESLSDPDGLREPRLLRPPVRPGRAPSAMRASTSCSTAPVWRRSATGRRASCRAA